MDFKKEIIRILSREIKGVKINLESPKNPEFGDYSFPCFGLAEKFRENPIGIAKRIAALLKKPGSIERIEAKGPYINFFINKESLVKNVLGKILKEKESYGDLKTNKRLIIEHTSINPNASPHVGRARNALIGDALVRIHRFLGYKVRVKYWVNDVGKQVAMLVYGSKGKKVNFDDLLKIYVRISKRVEIDKNLEKKIFKLINSLESGNKETINLFKKTVGLCLRGQLKILNGLGIRYDEFDYESKYLRNKQLNGMLKKLEESGRLFTDEEGRKVLDQKEFNFAMKSPVLVLTRADGTSLYPLRDIAYTIGKVKEGENIIVLGEDQKLYFEQIAAALKILGYKTPKAVHYSFVLLADGKMSTRKGNVVLLEDFMKEAVNKANKEIVKRYNKKDDKLAKVIGYGAIKYGILKVSNEKNVIFDWAKALDFEGETGPYLQYSYARASSILRKVKNGLKKIDFSLLNTKEEINLISKLEKFPEVVLKAKESLEPHLVANYAFELAKTFNEFYHVCKCIGVEKDLQNARLGLVTAFRYVIKNSLNLLGIQVSERM
ncbi:MAG: arginine--tRNA ligase [Nanoarchaeota archaeon]